MKLFFKTSRWGGATAGTRERVRSPIEDARPRATESTICGKFLNFFRNFARHFPQKEGERWTNGRRTACIAAF